MRVSALLLSLLLAACVSETKERWTPAAGPETTVEVPPIRPLRSAVEAKPSAPVAPAPPCEKKELAEPCKHVWLQETWHTYWQETDGVPVQAICIVTRCAKCGETRHECQRATEDARRRTPRSR